MSPSLDRRRFLQASVAAGQAAALASLPAAADTGDLTAGAAKRDITPENGDQFFGYVRPDIRADGVSIRLFAHALVLDDGERKLALVTTDLGAPEIKDAVLDHARPLGFDRDSVLFAATHTHAGPNEMGDWIAAQIGDAIAEADANREPAVAGWGTTEVDRACRSRSVEAHLANHGQDHIPETANPELDPKGPEHTRDTTLRLLRVESPDGSPIAAWSHFSVHPTAYTVHNTTYSADLSGAAMRWFDETFDGSEQPVAMYTSGNLGDLIPLYDDYNQHAVADAHGRRIARGMQRAWEAAGESLTQTLPVDGRARSITFQGQEVGDGHQVASMGWWGLPTYGGGKNGPTIFYEAGFKGKRRPEATADPVHGRKILTNPAPFTPDVEVQALRVGDRLLLATPGEPTTQAGRRMRRAARDAGPEDITDVAVVGVANGYNAYFTTPEEYDQQHYEGGHTVFGKYSTLLVQENHTELATSLREPSSGVDPQGSRPESPAAPTGDGANEAELTVEPPATVERMETVSIEWSGGQFGRDRPVGDPFIVLERRAENGWNAVASDLDLGFVWREPDFTGTYVARYDVPPDIEPGTYRLRVQGGNYTVPTPSFEIVPSTGLDLRGVATDQHGQGASRLIFKAQNPAPDPETHLRSRRQQPRGGTVEFVANGRTHEARWDADTEGWVTTVGGLEAGDEVIVPAGGLVDRLGNRSGEETVLTVGEVDEIEWPPNMGVGGGRPPGPGGVGTFPP